MIRICSLEVFWSSCEGWIHRWRISELDNGEGVQDSSSYTSRSALWRSAIFSEPCTGPVAFGMANSPDSSRNNDNTEQGGNAAGDSVKNNPGSIIRTGEV